MRLAGIAGNRLNDWSNIEGGRPGVVAADPLRGRAAEIERLAEEVRVGAGGDVHDGVRAVDELQLAFAPARALRTFVLAVADLDGPSVTCLCRGGCVEVELDHLPVAFVWVVPVVEDVEEPVLQRELPGPCCLGSDVRVDRGLRPGGDRALPLLVRAAWVERVPREVEVVAVELLSKLRRRRPDRNQVGAIPRAAQ